MHRWASERQSQPDAVESDDEGGAAGPINWDKFPEQAAAVIVHHNSILRLKRMLLTYTCAMCLIWHPLCSTKS